MITSLVIFNKSNRLDNCNTTEGQRVSSTHKGGEKRLDNLDLNNMQSLSTNFEAENEMEINAIKRCMNIPEVICITVFFPNHQAEDF